MRKPKASKVKLRQVRRRVDREMTLSERLAAFDPDLHGGAVMATRRRGGELPPH